MAPVAGLANLLAFQLGWFACVLGAARGRPWAGTCVALLLVGAHLWRTPRRAAEWRLIATAALLGAVGDTLLARSGWLRYAAGALLPATAPLWIIALWMLFATTLRHSLAWLQRRPLVSAACGALGGPLAYFGGARLGALVVERPMPAYGALAAGWAGATVLLVHMAARHD
jgi:hypothetical protein